MLKTLKRKLTILISAVALLAPVAMPAVAGAQTLDDQVCQGVNFDTVATCDPQADTDSETKINDTLKLVINLFSIVVGVISVIMIIVGGLKYITSGGDSAKITSAKNSILYAVIGLVIVALAQFIVRFVLAKVAQTT